MIPPTGRTAVTSLRSTVCPHCGGGKKARQTLCGRAYFKLPLSLRKALYSPVGSGYEQAIAKALDYLGVKSFINPGDVQ